MAEEQERERIVRRPLPEWTSAIARAGEPLWIGSLAALFVVWGYSIVPILIQRLGHSGRTETVEWLVYMSMLVAFPAMCVVVAVIIPRLAKGSAATMIKAFVILATLAYAIAFAVEGRLALALIALIPALATTLTSVATMRIIAERPRLSALFMARM